MLTHITFLKCDAPGCLVDFSSDGLPSNSDRYVFDAALRHGWSIEQESPASYKMFCPAHSNKIREAQTLPAEKAIRLLTSNAPALRSAPPFLVGKLKLMLSDFNAKTFTWRNT
jgi:hypothetical protein